MSNDKETIRIGNESFEIEVRPITLIFKAPNVMHDVQTPSRIMINSLMTLDHVRTARVLHHKTEELFKIVFPDYHRQVTLENIRQDGSGMQHVLGLVNLSLTLVESGTAIGWRYPESYLHPAAQCNLADVLIWLMRWANTKGIEVTL